MVDDEVVVGCVSAPMLQRRWWASKDGGAWTGRSLLKASECHVSDVSRLDDASLSYSSFYGWDERDRLDAFLALSRRCWRTRAYGDFWSYMLLAEGAVDLAAEPELELYDMAALDVIVREAGGMFTSLDGTPGPPAATRWPATAGCTTRRSRSSARCPTTRTTPTSRRGGTARCTTSARVGGLRSRIRRRGPTPTPSERRSRYGRDEQPGEVEPAVAARRPRRRVADRHQARSGRACPTPRCRGGCRRARGSSPRRRRRRRPAATARRTGTAPGRRTRRPPSTSGRSATRTPYAAQSPPTDEHRGDAAHAGAARRTPRARARTPTGRPGRAPAARTPARCRSGRCRPPASG